MTKASIFQRERFERFVLSLKSSTLVRQWRDDSVGKVGGKIFCLLDRDGGEIWLKVSDLSFEMMREEPGIRPAPYFARAKWLAIAPDCALSESEICAYIEMAHRLISKKLTRKAQAALGLMD